MSPVRSVETNMESHTVTVEFDDEQISLEKIIQALNDAGYTVPKYSESKKSN